MAIQPENKEEMLTWKALQAHALWWIGLLYQFTRFFHDVLFKYWRTTVPFILAGLLLMLGLLRQMSMEYQMVTTLVYGDLHPKIFGDMAAKLNTLLDQGRTDKVSRLMQLSERQAKKIRKVEATDNKGKKLTTNYTFRKEPMIFSITLSDTIAEDSLRRAILGYFNSNPFTADRMEMKKRHHQEELAYIEEQLLVIDNILASLYANGKQMPSQQGTVTIENSNEKNAYELLSFSRDLHQRKAEIERSLAIPENVVPIDNFILLPKAIWNAGHIMKAGTLGAVLGFLLASIFLFWQKKLRQLAQP